jgi:Fe-S oxidoreductase
LAWLGGISPSRRMPLFAGRAAARRGLGRRTPVPGADVLLLIDTFTRAFRPELLGSAERVLAESGTRAAVVDGNCCGLTWISTGQLTIARRVLTRTLRRLAALGDAPIVVLEPSCAAALRHDAPQLLGTPEAHQVAGRVTTFAEQLDRRLDAGWSPPSLAASAALVQVHCHETAVLGSGVQRRVLGRLGVPTVEETQGCCGLAGNFGVEREHHEVSMAVAELSLGPALRRTSAATPVLADGFSCQTQIAFLGGAGGAPARHLAELVDEALTARRPAGAATISPPTGTP